MNWHALHQMERDLADSDPRLSQLFLDFARQTGRSAMPRTEKIGILPSGWPDRLRESLRCAVALLALACAMCLGGFRPGQPWLVPMLRAGPPRTNRSTTTRGSP